MKCTKCGKVAINSIQVRDEEGILIAVKYQHEMLPESGYVWTCTQAMQYEAVKRDVEHRKAMYEHTAVKKQSLAAILRESEVLS